MKRLVSMVTLIITLIAALSSNEILASSKKESLSVEEKIALVNLFNEIVSDRSDIERKFKNMTDDFVYIHEGYGGEYSRQALFNGFVRNLKNGMYKGERAKVIEQYIDGLNMLVIKSRSGKATLFEFRDKKIARIREFW